MIIWIMEVNILFLYDISVTLVAKAFAGATVIVFGGAMLTIGLVVSHLELHTASDLYAPLYVVLPCTKLTRTCVTFFFLD